MGCLAAAQTAPVAMAMPRSPNSSAQEGVAVPVAGKLLRRTEAARMLGVSKSTLRRMEGTSLTPVVAASETPPAMKLTVAAVAFQRFASIASLNRLH
jgi:predicted DNA-binding transcriptional regulator AlpA